MRDLVILHSTNDVTDREDIPIVLPHNDTISAYCEFPPLKDDSIFTIIELTSLCQARVSQ